MKLHVSSYPIYTTSGGQFCSNKSITTTTWLQAVISWDDKYYVTCVGNIIQVQTT